MFVGARESRFARDDDANVQRVRRFIAKPSSTLGITKKLTFDDQDTLTFFPPQPKPEGVAVPTLLDLLKEFAVYLASLKKSRIAVSPDNETSVVSRSNVSLKSISPLKPVNSLLPKRKGRIQVCEDEAMDFGRDDEPQQQPRFEDTEADFRSILKQNRQIDLSIDDDEVFPDPVPVKSQFPLREIPKRKPLQEKPALPKRKSRVTFDDSTAEVNTAFMAQAIANCPQMNLNIDDEDIETKTVFDSNFDDEHSAILPTQVSQPFFVLKDYDLTVDIPAFDALFEFLVGAFPRRALRQLKEEITAENERVFQEATRLSEQHKARDIELPSGDVAQEMEHRCAAEALGFVMEKIMPRLEFLQQMHAAADVLLKAQLAVQRQSTPSTAMDDVDEIIEQLKQTRTTDNQNDERYGQLRSTLPFKVTKLVTRTPSPSVSAICGGERITMKEVTGDLLHARIANDQRYKRFRAEFLELMKIAPDIMFVDEMLSFVVSTEKLGMRFAVVLKVPSYYPWCLCTVSSIRVDFGATLDETLKTVNGIASSISMGDKWLTRFVRALFDHFQV